MEVAVVVVLVVATAAPVEAGAGPARRMTDPAHALLALQETDSALDRLAHRRQTLPERRALTDAEARATAVAGELAATERRADELAAEIRRREDEVAANEARAASLEQALDSGTGGSPRDLAAMADEVQGIRRRIRVLEDALLELLEEAETVGGTQSELRQVRDERHAEVTQAAARLEAVEAELVAEEAELVSQRAERAAGLAPDLLATYDRLRARLDGVAVAPLEGARCGGCHLTLPATELDALRHAPPDALVRHEECGRILVRPAP
jgi:predicted  nucleic acid-binding Zn-ribbon protein